MKLGDTLSTNERINYVKKSVNVNESTSNYETKNDILLHNYLQIDTYIDLLEQN